MPDLFDLAESAPHNGTPTSAAAARSVLPHVARLEAVVLAAVRGRGERGATCDEIEVETGLSHQCASARVHAISRRGLIRDSGVRRKTRSGRAAIAWVVVGA